MLNLDTPMVSGFFHFKGFEKNLEEFIGKTTIPPLFIPYRFE
jgi:hypothetical protein